MTTAERFMENVSPEPTTGCWLWTKAWSCGYGEWWMDKKVVLAHRASYQMFVGPIPDGLELDHLCRTPCCVNPKHLEAVTSAENSRRGLLNTVTKARAAARTHYSCGHPITEENTWKGMVFCGRNGKTYPSRVCRTCGVEKLRLKREARKAARLARSI